VTHPEDVARITRADIKSRLELRKRRIKSGSRFSDEEGRSADLARDRVTLSLGSEKERIGEDLGVRGSNWTQVKGDA